MFEIKDTGDKLEVYRGGALFCNYFYKGYIKPWLGPILTSDGESYTRADEHNPEHPHQRSVFVGQGEVTREGLPTLDFWNEPEDSGIAEHVRFDSLEHDRFSALNIWRSRGGVPYLDERREFIFGENCGTVTLEHTIIFTASYGTLTLGATKEAGPLGIRVADALRGDRGGKIVNAEGLAGESGCWGKTSEWCRYDGVLDGKSVSIKVEDDRRNDRWPTAWHVRDYGLFAANNFYFKGGETIDAGECKVWRYKISFS
jgi:F0F1-type ATP synthase, beta subunit